MIGLFPFRSPRSLPVPCLKVVRGCGDQLQSAPCVICLGFDVPVVGYWNHADIYAIIKVCPSTDAANPCHEILLLCCAY